jgi:hypothetical protein
VILLILVALLWIAVLAPGVITRFSERRSAGSIDSFHNRLHLLERTGPKLIAPAFRLGRTQPSPLAVGDPLGTDRPSLKLLETALPESEADQMGEHTVLVSGIASSVSEGRGDDFVSPSVRMLDGPSLGTLPRTDLEELPSEVVVVTPEVVSERGRSRAARRRRDVVTVLALTTVLSGLLGVVPSLRMALIGTACAGVLLLSYVALAVFAVSSSGRSKPVAIGLGVNGDRLRLVDGSRLGAVRRPIPISLEGDDDADLPAASAG